MHVYIYIQLNNSLQSPHVYRFKLPFEAVADQLESTHPSPPPLDHELLTSDPLHSMLRLMRCCAVAGGVENLTAKNADTSTEVDSDDAMAMPHADLVALECSSVRAGLDMCCKHMSGASSHREAVAGIHRLELEAVGLAFRTVARRSGELCNWRQLLERYMYICTYVHTCT